MLSYASPDLTQHPPRSPRTRLGGFVHLARLLDKTRAHAAGKAGEYNYNCPLDQRFFTFTGIDASAFLEMVKSGKSDTEALAWVLSHSTPKRDAWEIEAWSRWLENLAPGDVRRHTFFAESIARFAPDRDDIRTLFDRLEVDDYVAFGGKA